jgi:hypothetical protein
MRVVIWISSVKAAQLHSAKSYVDIEGNRPVFQERGGALRRG